MSPTPKKRVLVVCPMCGEHFTLHSSAYRKNVKKGIRTCCSRLCARHYWPLVKSGKVPA